MRDVAELAGVSSATVSYVLAGRSGGRDRISETTRQRVLEAAGRLGYVPNQTARSLRRRRTERVCLCVARLGVPYNDLLAQAMEAEAEARGYSLVIAVGGSLRREQRVMAQLRRGLADGVVFFSLSSESENAVCDLVRKGLAVALYSNAASPEGVDVVRTTEAESCYEGVRYLIRQGHRRIGFIGDTGPSAPTTARFRSYRRALEEARLDASECLCRDDEGKSREHAYHCALELLRSPDRPSAIFAATDLAAISALWAAQAVGLRVPQDVALMGAGNIPDGLLTTPPLTTIGPPELDFSSIIGMLFSRLAGEAPPEGRTAVIPWEIILRASA
jgi:DNA-binding LacI/PurR family transcriptional regulator